MAFSLLLFFFNDTATTEIYTLSLHDALPISILAEADRDEFPACAVGDIGVADDAGDLVFSDARTQGVEGGDQDRKSTRPNSSHPSISYAVFCLKKKKDKCKKYDACSATE